MNVRLKRGKLHAEMTQMIWCDARQQLAKLTNDHNNTNDNDNVYAAVIMSRPLQERPGSFDECRLSDLSATRIA